MARLPREFSLRVLVYPNPDDPRGWAAHCLEMDLMGFGETVQEALEELLQAIDGQIRNAAGPEQVFFPAPPEVWKMIPKCRPIPDELVERAVRTVFGKTGRFVAQTWTPQRNFARVTRELARA
jgi:hypothetical protein